MRILHDMNNMTIKSQASGDGVYYWFGLYY